MYQLHLSTEYKNVFALKLTKAYKTETSSNQVVIDSAIYLPKISLSLSTYVAMSLYDTICPVISMYQSLFNEILFTNISAAALRVIRKINQL